MNKTILGIVCGILALMLITACSPPPEKQCSADQDCVPAICCHPSDAVNKQFAPDCRGELCTMECTPGTLDCGQGEIKCLKNRCTAVITE